MSAHEPFTKDNAALLLIDYQQGTIKIVHSRLQEQVARNGLLLAKIAKALDIPTVLTSSLETNVFQGPMLEGFSDILPDAFANRIQRAGEVDALTNEEFALAVRATGRTNLIMAGITTDVCLVHPTRRAVRDGYQVQAVVDASGSNTLISEDIALRTMEAGGVGLTTIPQLASELAQNWAASHGGAVQELLATDYQSHLIEDPSDYR